MRSRILSLFLVSAAFAEAPLTLDDCRRLARERNAEVATARMELDAAGQTKKAAFTKYFPQVSATGALLAADKPLLDMPTMGLELGQKTSYLALAVQQPLFAGGRIFNGNRLASLGEDVARAKVSLAERDAVAQAEEKYWTLLSLQEKRRTLAAYDTLLGALQAQVGDAVGRGLSSRNDRLKVGLKRGEMRVDRLRLESGLRLAARDLRQHLGLEEDTSLVLSDTMAIPESPDRLADLRRGAIDRRIESRLLSQGVRAEQLQVDMESGTRLPTIAVGAQAFRAELKGVDPVKNVIVFGMVSVPISDLWGETYSTAAKRVKVREATLRESETRRKMAMGLDKDWDDLVRGYQANLVAEDGVAQAEENLREEVDRRNNGISTLSDVLDAQALRQQALDKRIDSRKEYWLALCAYRRSAARAEIAR
jgi:outer membrane protein